MLRRHLGLLVLPLLLSSCAPSGRETRADNNRIAVEFDKRMHSRAVLKFEGDETALGPFAPTEYLRADGREVRDFNLVSHSQEGRRFLFSGEAQGIRKQVAVTADPAFPSTLVFDVTYTNTGFSPLAVESWTSHAYSIDASPGGGDPAFWSYQPGSYENRPDWVLPLKPGFRQENFLGMNGTDYGGGTPVADVWRRDAGIGVGHVEPVPKQVLLPVTMPDARHAAVAVTYKVNRTLPPGESLKTFRTFVTAHRGDYFATLVEYRRFMVAQGVKIPKAPNDAFEPIWCAWGYGRNFTEKQVYGTFPIVKKLGFRWVTLDDGWQTAEGDWYVNPKKSPEAPRM
jgi:alpha-galactosidase